MISIPIPSIILARIFHCLTDGSPLVSSDDPLIFLTELFSAVDFLEISHLPNLILSKISEFFLDGTLVEPDLHQFFTCFPSSQVPLLLTFLPNYTIFFRSLALPKLLLDLNPQTQSILLSKHSLVFPFEPLSTEQVLPGVHLLPHRTSYPPLSLYSVSPWNLYNQIWNDDVLKVISTLKVGYLLDYYSKLMNLFKRKEIVSQIDEIHDFFTDSNFVEISNVVCLRFRSQSDLLLFSQCVSTSLQFLNFLSIAGLQVDGSRRSFSVELKVAIGKVLSSPNLKVLNMSYNPLRNEGLKFCLETIVSNASDSISNIQYLNLCRSSVGVAAVETFVSYFDHFPNLEHVDLSNNDLKLRGFLLILTTSSSIKKLNLSSCSIILTKVSEISSYITGIDDLKSNLIDLDLAENSLSLQVLVEFLKYFPKIERLAVGYQSLYRQQIPMSHTFLSFLTVNHSRLTSIDLSYTQFTADSMTSFKDYIQNQCPHFLSLKACYFDDPQVVISSIITAINTCQLPVLLDFSSSNVSSALDHISLPQIFHSKLAAISLNYLDFTSRHLRIISDCIPKSLTSLSINSNKIGGNPNVWYEFGHAIEQSNLVKVSFNGNRPHLETLFFTSLSYCKTLRELDFSNSITTSSVVKCLCDKFPPNLKYLNISDISISSYLPLLFLTLNNHSSIEKVFLDKCSINFDLFCSSLCHLSSCSNLKLISMAGCLSSNIVKSPTKSSRLHETISEFKRMSLVENSSLQMINLTLITDDVSIDLFSLETSVDFPLVKLLRPNVMSYDQIKWAK
ncbi:hypothetical protein GEMRC1_011789 [Eukaryota sp. GEM-RC1]